MQVDDADEFSKIISVCWMKEVDVDALQLSVPVGVVLQLDHSLTGHLPPSTSQSFPLAMPFSQAYPMCCIDIRNFVDLFYQFVDGVSNHHKDTDELLRKVRLISPALFLSPTIADHSLTGLASSHSTRFSSTTSAKTLELC